MLEGSRVKGFVAPNAEDPPILPRAAAPGVVAAEGAEGVRAAGALRAERGAAIPPPARIPPMTEGWVVVGLVTRSFWGWAMKWPGMASPGEERTIGSAGPGVAAAASMGQSSVSVPRVGCDGCDSFLREKGAMSSRDRRSSAMLSWTPPPKNDWRMLNRGMDSLTS